MYFVNNKIHILKKLSQNFEKIINWWEFFSASSLEEFVIQFFFELKKKDFLLLNSNFCKKKSIKQIIFEISKYLLFFIMNYIFIFYFCVKLCWHNWGFCLPIGWTTQLIRVQIWWENQTGSHTLFNVTVEFTRFRKWLQVWVQSSIHVHP